MNNKTLLVTLGAAVVIGGIGIGLYDSKKSSGDLQSPLILPELASVAANIEHIKLASAGNKLVVESHKDGGQWLIDNLGNYNADIGPLSTLINNLKDARKIEAKTAKPELFHHLGLRDISDGQSKAMLVSISGGGKEYKLLIGDSAKSGSGQYVRVAGENQTYLVDKSFNKPDKAEDWVKTKLFDFELTDIASVSLEGVQQYSLTKADKEQASFALSPIPQTHELKYESITDALPRSVANLGFEALVPMAQKADVASEQTIVVKLFDNPQTIELGLSKVEDKHYVTVKGDNPLWSQWAYELTDYNYNQLIKAKNDYLNEIKTAQAPAEQEVPQTP